MTWTYDASYQLPRKQRAGATSYDKKFVYDGQHIAMVFDADNTLTHRYLHGPGIDMILADEAFDGASGNFLDLYWMLGDHQGSVTSVLSHNSGQTSLVQQLAYTAFGAIGSIKDGQGNNVAGLSSRFGYTGREFDPETGDYYYRARYYDPQSGRFLSQDPIGFAAGDMNLYRYVGNAKPNFVDPSGLRAGQHTTTDQPLGRTGPVGPVRYNDGVGPQGTLPLGSGQRPPQNIFIMETQGARPRGTSPLQPKQSPFYDDSIELLTTNSTEGVASLLLPVLLAAIDPLAEDSIDRGFWEMIRRHDFETAKLILQRYEGFCKNESLRKLLQNGLNDYMRHHDKWYKQMMQKPLSERRDWLKGIEITIRNHMTKRGGCDTTETIRLKIQRELIRGSLEKRPKF